MKNIIIQAHRGVSSDYPENTLSAFRAAVKLGYGMIELDTKFTADNRCVILHDKNINRTARFPDGSKLESATPISGLTLAEARAYDYGLWFGEEFRGEQLPTLEDTLAFALEMKIPLKFDNVMFTHTNEQLEIMYGAIERMNALDYSGFTASTVEDIEKTLARFPSAEIHFDGEASAENLERLARIVNPERLTIWLRYANARTGWIKAAAVRKYAKIGVWLLDTQEELETAVNIYGASIIETNGTIKP